MRYLVFLRGIPGSGKSTFVRENNLIPYTISSDLVRMLIKPPVLSATGKFMLSQKINPRVWGLIYSLIKSRMEDGEFTVLDATNAGNADISKYRKLVKTYRYKAFCVDFSDISPEIAKKRNMQRPIYEIVPETVIDEMYFIINSQTVPSFVTVIKPNEFHEKLQYRITDFSNYTRIHHIGDINGNYTALMKYLQYGLENSDLYIFTGDYTEVACGAKSTELVKLLVSIMCRNNVILLEGEQEKYLCNLGTAGKESVLKSGLFELYRRMEPCIHYKFRNKRVLVTHGGLSCLPENLIYVGTVQMINGVGEPQDADIIAASFNWHTNEHTYQVHGHRNPKNLPIENGRTFNLSCEAERGRVLRVLTLDRDGFRSQEIETRNKPV